MEDQHTLVMAMAKMWPSGESWRGNGRWCGHPERLATLGGHHSTLGGWSPWEAGTGGEKQSTNVADAGGGG